MNPAYGWLAEFETPAALLAAARRAREAGYRQIEAYSPFPVHGLPEVLDISSRPMALVMLLGGLFGGLGAYLMQYYATVVSYPLIVAGRPYHSWPSYVPVTFELTVLGAALAGFFGFFISARLPKPYHPVFEATEFARASEDRFFLCIEALDPKFSVDDTRTFLEGLGPLSLTLLTPVPEAVK